MNVAYIPVRGGSKSIPMKNIKLIAGKPLLWYATKAACACDRIDRVYVCTDSQKISETVVSFGFDKVEIIGRSKESASDTAITELGMLEFAAKYDFENIALIQATSPLITSSDLINGFELFSHNDTDSVISVVLQKRFIWENNSSGFAYPINYNLLARPRRQNFNGFYVENGAFYITSKAALLNSGFRISGNIKTVEMPEESYYEIDEPSDWIVVENLLKSRKGKGKSNIKMFLTDCDGVLTDGGMYYSQNGDVMKKFNTHDGMGFQLLHENGIIIGIITGENSDIVKKRAEKLKVEELHMGIKDKLLVLRSLSNKYKIPLEQIAYIGDDINDLECIKVCGVSACPKDAVNDVKNAVDYVCNNKSGEGGAREFIEYLLRD